MIPDRRTPDLGRPSLARLARDEDGASMVFAAITLYALTLSIMFVYQIGLISADRIQIQTAADAAAYSAAQVEANALNAIAQLNDGMAFLTYTLMRHAVDAAVYGTLNEFQRHGDPKPPGELLMGGSEGKARIDEVRRRINHSEGPFQRGRGWLADVHLAARLILASTPRHMRDTAILVARENGASHVGLAGDFDAAFAVTARAVGGGGGGLGAGFWQPSERDRGFYDPLYALYEEQRTPELKRAGGSAEEVARGLPEEWWDAPYGTVASSPQYGQLRICWVEEDWGHRPGEGHGDAASPFNLDEEPNGHWHLQHQHHRERRQVDPNTGQEYWVPDDPVDHGGPPAGGGSEVEGGHAQDPHPIVQGEQRWAGQDPTTLSHEQHYLHLCPVCGPTLRGVVQENRGLKSAAVWKRIGDVVRSRTEFATPDLGKGSPMEVVVLRDGFFPRPLIGLEALLRSGVTAVTYRRSRGIGDTFAASPWGMVAVASAQVGLRVGDRVLPLRKFEGRAARYERPGGEARTIALPDPGGSERKINLLYGNAPEADDGRVRFGARLVPVSSPNTWQQAHARGDGLAGLLEGRGQVAWYRCRDGEAEMPAEVQQLGRFVTADGPEALRAFWH